jgi:hypothetical protein
MVCGKKRISGPGIASQIAATPRIVLLPHSVGFNEVRRDQPNSKPNDPIERAR